MVAANAKKGTKRAAPQVESDAAPARKRTSPHASMLEGIASALTDASTLPCAAKEMLVSMVQGSLGSPKDERHRYQSSAVEMIGDALAKIRAEMERAVAAESEKVAAVEASKVELDAARDKSQELLASRVASSKEIKAELVQVSVALSTAKKSLVEVQEAQKSGDAAHIAVEKEFAAHNKVMEESFGPLKTGTWESEEEAKGHLELLQAIVAKIEVEESLISSLPTACLKKPSDRGAFDTMIFEELEKVLSAKVATLRAKVAEGAPAAGARAAAVQTAQAVVDEAKGKVQESATKLNAAQNEEKEQETATKEAEKAVKDFAPNFRKATQARDQLVAELEGFDLWPLASYNTLKELVSKKEEEAVADVPKVVAEESLTQEVAGAVGA